MAANLEFIANYLPDVTVDDVRHSFTTVDLANLPVFMQELEAFIHKQLEAVELPQSVNAPLTTEGLEQMLSLKAASLRAAKRWVPNETDIQRGRVLLLEAYDQKHNLPLPDFAQLAGKSRQQIYKDIDARRLLALNVGRRGQRLPDWQLEPIKQQLTQAVLQKAGNVDNWTLYHALCEPIEGLDGNSPIDAVTEDSIEDVVKIVLNVLSIH